MARGVRFTAPIEYVAATGQTKVPNASLYAGMPAGIEFMAKWAIFDLPLLTTSTIPGGGASPGNSWTVTETGAGGTVDLSDDLVPPRLIITNDALDNDSEEAQWTAASGSGELFALRSGKKLYFRCQFSLTDANNDIDTVEQCDLFLGLAITSTTVLDGNTDFIGFHKADGSGTVNFVAGKNAGAAGALVDQLVQSTGVTLTAADAGTAEADLHTFEFLAIGTTTVIVYADGVHVATVNSTTQLPDDENLCPTICLQNGEAVAKVMHLSQLFYAMER
jgi:hypothetical protein